MKYLQLKENVSLENIATPFSEFGTSVKHKIC